MLLKVCMCLCESERSADTGLSLAVREMVRHMKEDLGKAAAGSIVMSSALQVASSRAQAERMWNTLAKVYDGKSIE